MFCPALPGLDTIKRSTLGGTSPTLMHVGSGAWLSPAADVLDTATKAAPATANSIRRAKPNSRRGRFRLTAAAR